MAELNVSRKNISQLLTDTKGEIFIIPEYQRPYKWDIEKCDVLWNDIVNFHYENKDNRDKEYFLGTIVTCKTEDGITIIDGQQRVTSLFLLLRAFYSKLEEMANQDDKNIIGLKAQIAPCIWDVNRKSKTVEDYSKIHIISKVATEKDNDIFHSILRTGRCDDKKSLYAINYNFFYDKCATFAKNEPLEWEDLCISILDNCIVFPIECDTLDSALTIFSTLNDRGMPLSDSDIFKAQIYKTKKTEDEKKIFTDNWKELSEIVDDARLSLDDIFRYYTHVIRAKGRDKSKEIGLRKFYSESNYKRLSEDNLIDNLTILANFWKSINAYETVYLSEESKKYFHCLNCYPNEYWKYITSVFFFYCSKNGLDIKDELGGFLEKITAFLYLKFIQSPTVNAIKDIVFVNCISVYNDEPLQLDMPSIEDFRNRLSLFCSSKISKGLLLINAYLDENQSLLPLDFQIEHIFPKKWQNTNYNGWEKNEADEYLEKFGNKVVIERKLNIQAGNGYFGKKKLKYSESHIQEIQKLSKYPSDDWSKYDIESREEVLIEALNQFFIKVLT